MKKKKKEKVEYRYYEMPGDAHMFALLGEKWIQTYGHEDGGLHLHNHMEIGYCYYGTGDLILEDRSYRYEGDSFSIIPAGALHSTVSTPDVLSRWEYIFLDVEGYIRDFFKGNPHYQKRMAERINSSVRYLRIEENPAVGKLIREILEEMRKKEEYYKENVTGLMIQLLAKIARMGETGTGEIHPVRKKADRLEMAVEYIHLHYAQDIRIESLAELCYVSENQFRKLFREQINMSPLEYINFTRIHAACEMLRETQLPVAEIAAKTGFSTLSTFNRNFRKFLGGVSPCQWRKRPENYVHKLKDYWVKVEEGW